MKVLVLGASGIIGQHLRLCVPEDIEPLWFRQNSDSVTRGTGDLSDRGRADELLRREDPDVIINLAGESRVDIVERNPENFEAINVQLPAQLASYCNQRRKHLIHVSSQAVFSGDHPPYESFMGRSPVNRYGEQKLDAEMLVEESGDCWSIARPTFVLGIRPMPGIGRQNPMEQILTQSSQRQVDDRWFSVSFARDVATDLWLIALGRPIERAINIGLSFPVSRHQLAQYFVASRGIDLQRCSHDDFAGIAPRPINTTYAGAGSFNEITHGLEECAMELADQQALTLAARAKEISIFTGRSEADCLQKLSRGFGELHNEVAKDFRAAGAPQDDQGLLNWYRTTEAYVWELSAYHADAGFNYSGMCRGVAERLAAVGAKRILCLGDGIGDLTLTLCRAGFDAVYHDLAGSRTAAFAMMRFQMYLGEGGTVGAAGHLTGEWNPEVLITPNKYDAICSFDFLEHVTDVETWLRVIHQSLRSGGLFFAQNAFNCGSGPDGAIPMHLSRNDRFERDWDPTLAAMDFTQLSSNWYQTGPTPRSAEWLERAQRGAKEGVFA